MPDLGPVTDQEQPLAAGDGRRRLAEALRRPAAGQVTVAVLLGLLGFGAVTQVRTSEMDNRYAGFRDEQLIEVLGGLEGAAQRADDQIAELNRRRADLQDETRGRQAALDQVEQETSTLNILAGLVPVTGPGLRITISETDRPVDVDTILDTVQELRTAGAEAMEFNDQVRVITQTSFDDGVGGLLVGDTEVEPPYVIDVIGDPTVLKVSGLDFADGPVAQLSREGAEVKVTELSRVEIASVRTPTKPEYASPVPDQ